MSREGARGDERHIDDPYIIVKISLYTLSVSVYDVSYRLRVFVDESW